MRKLITPRKKNKKAMTELKAAIEQIFAAPEPEQPRHHFGDWKIPAKTRVVDGGGVDGGESWE